MRRTSLVSIVFAALALGCAPSNPGLTIDAVLLPSDTCQYTSGSAQLVEGILDVNPDLPRPAGIRYFAVLRVANHLINNSNRVYPLMADPNVVTVESVEVEVLNTDGTSFGFGGLPNPYRVTATGTISSSTSNEPQIGVVDAEVLPAQYGASLPDTGTVILSIRVIGVTAGGAAITSGRTLLPVRLCSGCLTRCVRDSMTGDPIVSLSCWPGQDAVSDVCGP